MPCCICDQNHETAVCTYPSMLNRCTECFNVMLDSTHECDMARKATTFKRDVFAKKLVNVFKLHIKQNAATMHYFDHISGNFYALNDTILSPATYGAFKTTESSSGIKMLSYLNTKDVKFSFFVVVHKFGRPNISLRGVVIGKTVRLFKTNIEMLQRPGGKFVLPPEYKYNKKSIFIHSLQHEWNVRKHHTVLGMGSIHFEAFKSNVRFFSFAIFRTNIS